MFAVLVILFFTGLGLVLLRLGWRGSMVDDHPICARCGFDLYKLWPEQPRCPECGAAAEHHLRHGNRQRRPALVTAGAVLLSVAALPVGMGAWSLATGHDWDRSKPVWWLLLEADRQQRTEPVVNELRRRLQQGELSDEQVAQVMAVALDSQPIVESIPGGSVPDASRARLEVGSQLRHWSESWGVFAEEARAAGQLAKADLQRYLEQGIRRVPAIRSRLATDESLQIVWQMASTVADPQAYRVHRTRRRVTIGPWSAALPTGVAALPASRGASRLSVTDFGVEQFQPGTYTVRIEERWEVFHRSSNAPSSAPIHAWSSVWQDEVTILPEGTPSVALRVDEAWRADVEQAFQDVRLERTHDHHGIGLSVDTLWNELEQAVVYGRPVLVGPDGERFVFESGLETRRLPGEAGSGGGPHFAPGRFPDWLTEVDRATLRIEPAPDLARRSRDIFVIWGEPIVVEDIKITDD